MQIRVNLNFEHIKFSAENRSFYGTPTVFLKIGFYKPNLAKTFTA